MIDLQIFNVVFTGLPIIAYAVQERDVPPEKMSKYPQLYESGQKQQEFSMRLLYQWLVAGLCHSIIIFFMNIYAHTYALLVKLHMLIHTNIIISTQCN